ncbi:MAG: hypothetical protein ACTSSE_13310 [Candidatus Thorarchaeota archaeon]
MESKNRFFIPIIFSIVGILATFLVSQNLSLNIADAVPSSTDFVRAIEGPIQADVRTLLFVFLPVYLVVFALLTIPIALVMILFNKISRTATYDLGIFSTGEGFGTIKLLRRALVPSLFALSSAEIFLNLIPDWVFSIPEIGTVPVDVFRGLYDPLQTLLGALLALVVGIAVFAPTWILNDSGIVTQVKPNHMATRRCPDTEGIGRWFSNLIGGFAILAYPITVFYRYFYVRYIVLGIDPTFQSLIPSLFWIVGIPFLVMSFVLPFVILNEFGLSFTVPRIQTFARKLGAKDVKPKSLMLEMLEIQDHLNDHTDDSEIDSDASRLTRK